MTVPTITLNDGQQIPQLGFGVWQVSTQDIVPTLRTALEVGYRHIDTAAIYGNEEGVGQAIRESGVPREEIFVTTKLWNDMHERVPMAIRTSLDKLGLDHVDLYLIHWPTPMFGTAVVAWKAMERVRDEGLATSIGVCNFRAEDLDEIIAASDTVPAVNQIEVHPTLTQLPLVAANSERGIHTQSWTPLGKGDIELPEIVELAAEHGKTPAQVILRWHVQRGLITFPRSVTPSRIAENFDIFDFELSEAAMATIDSLDAARRCGPDPATFDRR